MLFNIMNDFNTVIKVENLSKIYKLYNKPTDRMKEALNPFKKKYHKDFYALQNINFEIKRGEIVGIIGKNGSGKSTLLKIITGVLTQTIGSATVNGKVAALLELGAGFNPEYTGLENIFFQGNIMGYSQEEMNLKLQSILDFADIGEFIHQPVKMYSSGMFARLAFALAINVEPDILIIDEALSVGDANFQLKCHKRMDELCENGVTILFVSHDTYSVKSLCSKAIFLKNGIQQSYGNSLDVVNQYLEYLESEADVNLNQSEIKVETQTSNIPVKITKVYATNYVDQNEISCLIFEDLEINIEFEVLNHGLKEVVLVFNLYRERDKVYICGATSIMDKIPPIKVSFGINKVKLKLPKVALLTGIYRLRVAINEKKGVGILYELDNALLLKFKDSHESEGLIHINREWNIND